MNVRLIKLSKEYYTQLSEMIDEWKLDHEVNQGNRSPWAIFKNDYHDFDYYLENLEIREPKDGKVSDSVFFLLDTDRNILLGAVNIRHCLNNHLLQFGGHIGDGVIAGVYNENNAYRVKVISEPENGERSNITFFIPDTNAAFKTFHWNI